jgi:release factor glutamine methyltransferase
LTNPKKSENTLHLQTANESALKRILAVTNAVAPPVYAPNDDSLLMVETIAQLPLRGRRVLDMGTGSGILGLYCALQGAEVTASDIDEAAINQAAMAASALGIHMELRVSDLFSNVPGTFDLVLFNPPYLPSAEVQDKSVDGGSGGVMLVDRFLYALPNHLHNRAMALLLLSSVNDQPSVELRHQELRFSIVAKKALFFEELQVLLVRLRDNLAI